MSPPNEIRLPIRIKSNVLIIDTLLTVVEGT
jgi:hypothetical protein